MDRDTSLTASDDESSPWSGPRLWKSFIVAGVLGVLVFATLSLWGDLNKLRTLLASYSWRLFAYALALSSGNYLLRALRWHYYLRRLDIVLRPWPSLLVFFSGMAMTITPGHVGEFLKSVLLKQLVGTPLARSAPLVVAERMTDLLALVLLTAIGASGTWGVKLLAAALASAALVVFGWRPLGHACIRVSRKVPALKRFTPKLTEAHLALAELATPASLSIGTSLALAAWWLQAVALWSVVRGIDGLTLGWQASALSYALSMLAGLVTLLPGGLGAADWSLAGLLEFTSGGSMSATQASAVTVLTRLATLWWALLVGVLALLLTRRRLRALANGP